MGYGDVSPYGEGVYGADTDTDLSGCVDCGEGWRIEATHLHTGVVKAVLRPVSMTWQDNYTAQADATLLVDTLDQSAYETWPHTTGVYISQVFPDGTRAGRFGGYVEHVAASGGGATTLLLKSMDTFLFHRLLANEDEGIGYTTPGYVSDEDPGDGLPQTQIAADLTEIALTGLGAIPLIPVATESEQSRVRSWVASDFKNLGQAVQELIDSVDGLRYILTHTFFEDPARWVTSINYTDGTDTATDVVLRSGFEAFRSTIMLDATNHATRIYGVGAGSGAGQMFSVAYDEDADLPEFQATVAFKDVTIPETLDELTRGEVTRRRDPATTITATLVGLSDVPPATLRSGDVIGADIGWGVFTFRDEQARVTGQTWKVAPELPVLRDLALDPIIRPSLSVKTQTPALPLVETPEESPAQTPITPPAQAAGLVTTVAVSSLTEISGMQFMGDGNVWVHNDENNNPQVFAVSLATGREAGNINVSGPSRVDPEAIRRHPDGRVLLGDIGDNDNNRSSVRLYEVGGSGAVYTLSYPFGPSNAEALLIHPSGELFIATKDGRVVTFGTGPGYGGTGVQVASGLVGGISDGTFTNNGKYALFTVVGSSVVYVYAYPGWTQVGTIGVPVLPKCEAITIESDCSFLITSEGANAPIYRVLIPTAFGGCV